MNTFDAFFNPRPRNGVQIEDRYLWAERTGRAIMKHIEEQQGSGAWWDWASPMTQESILEGLEDLLLKTLD